MSFFFVVNEAVPDVFQSLPPSTRLPACRTNRSTTPINMTTKNMNTGMCVSCNTVSMSKCVLKSSNQFINLAIRNDIKPRSLWIIFCSFSPPPPCYNEDMSCCPKILPSVYQRLIWCQSLNGGTLACSRAKDGFTTWSTSQVTYRFRNRNVTLIVGAKGEKMVLSTLFHLDL